jgi:hypothetical protein
MRIGLLSEWENAREPVIKASLVGLALYELTKGLTTGSWNPIPISEQHPERASKCADVGRLSLAGTLTCFGGYEEVTSPPDGTTGFVPDHPGCPVSFKSAGRQEDGRLNWTVDTIGKDSRHYEGIPLNATTQLLLASAAGRASCLHSSATPEG